MSQGNQGGDNMSPKAAWTAAFVAAQRDMPDIRKGKTATIPTKAGKTFSYSYADLADVVAQVRPVLTQHGLATAQDATGSQSISVETRIYHEAGHVEKFGPLTFASGADAQSAGSAITYARRYALCAALGIAPDEDDDGAAAKTVKKEPEPMGVEVAEVPASEMPPWVQALINTHGVERVVSVTNDVLVDNERAPSAEPDNLYKLNKSSKTIQDEIKKRLNSEPSSTGSDEGSGSPPLHPEPSPLSRQKEALKKAQEALEPSQPSLEGAS